MSDGVVIFVEGDTEEELFEHILTLLHDKANDNRFPQKKVLVKNIKGISNARTKLSRKFILDVQRNNPGISFDVFICYDTDVFDYAAKPVVDWKLVVDDLHKNGANSVTLIKAIDSIERWLLNDIQGIRNYLKIPETAKATGSTSLAKLQSLFKRANKRYIKGARVHGLIRSLDISVVLCGACVEVSNLCKALGISCTPQKKQYKRT